MGAGPSGMDAPAQPVERITDPFRVISALTQGDHDRAADLIVHMSDAHLAVLRPVAMALDMLTEAECEARRRAQALVTAAGYAGVELDAASVAERWEAPLPEPLPVDPESARWWQERGRS